MINKGFNISDEFYSFTELILNGKKRVETRNSKSLHSLIGQRVAIIRTKPHEQAMIIGLCTIEKCVEYKSLSAFRKAHKEHQIPLNDTHYSFNNKVKYGYVLTDIQKIKPTQCYTKGYVIRNVALNDNGERIIFPI